MELGNGLVLLINSINIHNEKAKPIGLAFCVL